MIVAASATAADPAGTVERLTGVRPVAVTDDTAARGRTRVVLWQPPLLEATAPGAGDVRRSALAETTELLADLPALACPRSRS